MPSSRLSWTSTREERGELEQAGARHRLAEQREAGGGERERARLGHDRRGAPNVRPVELEGGGELDHRGRRVPDRGQPVADVVVADSRP